MLHKFLLQLLYKGLAILGYVFVVIALLPFLILISTVSKLYEAIKDITEFLWDVTMKLIRFIPLPLKDDVTLHTITWKKIKEAFTWTLY